MPHAITRDYRSTVRTQLPEDSAALRSRDLAYASMLCACCMYMYVVWFVCMVCASVLVFVCVGVCPHVQAHGDNGQAISVCLAIF